jgi:hypothetical protein
MDWAGSRSASCLLVLAGRHLRRIATMIFLKEQTVEPAAAAAAMDELSRLGYL